MVGVHGDAVDVARVDHHRADACPNRGLEARHEQFAQLALGNPRRRAVLAAERHRVADEALRRGRNEDGAVHPGTYRACAEQRLQRRPWIALVAEHRGNAELGGQIGIFSERLVEARPERLPAQVEDGSEVPRDAAGARLVGGDLTRAAHQRRVERRRHRDVVREDRAPRLIDLPVHGVDAVHHRDAHARAPGEALDRGDRVTPFVRAHGGAVHVQQRTDVLLDDGVLELHRVEQKRGVGRLRPARHRLQRELRHLTDLLLQRHPPQQGLDSATDRIGRLSLGGRCARQEEQSSQQESTHLATAE